MCTKYIFLSILKITFCGRSMHSLLFAWGHLPFPQSSQVNSSSRRSYGWHSWQCQQQLSPWKKRRFCVTRMLIIELILMIIRSNISCYTTEHLMHRYSPYLVSYLIECNYKIPFLLVLRTIGKDFGNLHCE